MLYSVFLFSIKFNCSTDFGVVPNPFYFNPQYMIKDYNERNLKMKLQIRSSIREILMVHQIHSLFIGFRGSLVRKDFGDRSDIDLCFPKSSLEIDFIRNVKSQIKQRFNRNTSFFAIPDKRFKSKWGSLITLVAVQNMEFVCGNEYDFVSYKRKFREIIQSFSIADLALLYKEDPVNCNRESNRWNNYMQLKASMVDYEYALLIQYWLVTKKIKNKEINGLIDKINICNRYLSHCKTGGYNDTTNRLPEIGVARILNQRICQLTSMIQNL